MFPSNCDLVSLVELTLSGRNLRDLDVFSKSDPMCVVYTRISGQGSRWCELKRTECIQNTLNPDFATKVQLPYHFEEQQQLYFELYDIDTPSHDLTKHDFLGCGECTLAQIVTSGTYVITLCNKRGNGKGKSGTLIINCEELKQIKDELELQFVGRNMDKKRFFGLVKSNPFLTLLKSNEAGQFIVVHRTEVVKNTMHPSWKKFALPIRSLCNGSFDRTIKIECWDSHRNGSHKLIGDFYTTANILLNGPEGSHRIFYCENKKKKRRDPDYKHSGEVHLIHCQIKKAYSFLEYIQGGIQLNCSIAIDFTASNGDPFTPGSLHFISSVHSNQYEQALTAVGEIIQEYDSDKLFPVLGFGAKLPPDGRVSHEFFVNMHPTIPYCAGIAGVLEAYRHCIRQVQLHGPTNFAPIINHVIRVANSQPSLKEYFILLIITDGIITDMPLTKEAIVRASLLPISIIIVGVGGADFSAMEELDGDTVRLSFRGREAVRDIVQFVPFRNFTGLVDNAVVRARLAKEVLAEVPHQFLEYMKANNIQPNPPPYDSSAVQLPPDPEKVVMYL